MGCYQARAILYRYTVILEQEPDGGYVATVPALPGCVSQGDTGDAVMKNIREAAMEAPTHSETIQRVLAIPNHRQPRALVGFLTRPEIEALLAAPNRTKWLGRRDQAFPITAVQTGLRLSEMTMLRQEDVALDAGARVCCRGKERKEEVEPGSRPCGMSGVRSETRRCNHTWYK
jgi:predicted RNase H-like HicB family nuclease